MKFSFVIPTYNNKVLLKNTLEALNYQTGYGREDYEVIVVDDGSTDNTYEYIKGIDRNYTLKYIYLERDKDSCRSRTRNTGWRSARGEFIAFIDSDMVVRENYLKELDRCFSLNKDIVLTGPRLMLDRPTSFDDIISRNIFDIFCFNSEKYHLLEYRYYLYAITSYNASSILCPWVLVYSCNLAVPKTWLYNLGGFDENFKEWGMEDLELGYSFYKNGILPVFNYKLEALHQYHGERNDLIIEESKVPGYKTNIDYFLAKHPEALRMNSHIAYKFLSGDLSTSKMLSFDINPKKAEIKIEFRNREKLTDVKRQLSLLIKSGETKIIVNDYVEDTDLDIWIQLLDTTHNIVRYYPMSRQFNIEGMTRFINSEKERQKNTVKQKGELYECNR